jgi:hypothetical protein
MSRSFGVFRGAALGEVNVIEYFQGLPFLDDQFDSVRLLSAVAGVRRGHDLLSSGKAQDLTVYIEPSVAYGVCRRRFAAHSPIHDRALTLEEIAAIRRSTADILGRKPKWQSLFSVPIVIRGLMNLELVSLTNPTVPQHIFLGRVAFRDRYTLQEALVHELSHVWLGMLAEVRPLHASSDPGYFTLPSGTAGKTAAGVLLACLFAAAVIEYDRSIGMALGERAEYLHEYLIESLNLLVAGDRHLTPTGREVRDRLSRYAAESPERCWQA